MDLSLGGTIAFFARVDSFPLVELAGRTVWDLSWPGLSPPTRATEPVNWVCSCPRFIIQLSLVIFGLLSDVWSKTVGGLTYCFLEQCLVGLQDPHSFESSTGGCLVFALPRMGKFLTRRGWVRATSLTSPVTGLPFKTARSLTIALGDRLDRS